MDKPPLVSPIEYRDPQSYTPIQLADKILTTRSTLQGERKLVTVMFADVAGFTAISEKLDPEEVHRIMDGCCRILVDEIHHFEGTVGEFRGDGVMALFWAPIAHEDHARRACHAALNIQQALVPYREEIRKSYGIDFRMRIGLNSSTVVVGAFVDDLRMDYTAMGDTTNLAARMETTAEPGSVLVSASTHRLAREFFEFAPPETLQGKGKQEPVDAFRLLRPTGNPMEPKTGGWPCAGNCTGSGTWKGGTHFLLLRETADFRLIGFSLFSVDNRPRDEVQ